MLCWFFLCQVLWGILMQTSAFFVQLITGNPFYKSELKSMQAADRYRISYSHNRLFKPGGAKKKM